MPSKKKVLLLSYYWPPSGGSGVQRWMYFAKYLSDLDFDITVITVDEKHASYHTLDTTLEKEVSHIRVIKTKTLEPLKLYSLLKGGSSTADIPQGSLPAKKGFLDKVAAYVRGNYFIPDARVGWNSYAYPKAIILLKKEKFDVLITTGPPHSTHLVGKALKEKHPTLKWIADFRDPWQEIFYNASFSRTQKSKDKDAAFELSVLQGADLITTVGPSMKELLENKIPTQKEKVQVFYNGFDSDKFDRLFAKKQEKFTLSFIGFLGANYPFQQLYDILSLWDKRPEASSTVLYLIGKIDAEAQALFGQLTNVTLHISGNITHEAAMQRMIDSHVLLLPLPNEEYSKIIVSGKLLEYMAANRPILGLMNRASDAANIIEKYALGEVFTPGSDPRIAVDFLAQSYAKRGEYRLQNEAYSLFSRKEIARELAKVIHSLVEEK